MTRDKALSEAKKRWGAKAYIRAHDTLSSPEKRAAADALFQEAKSRIDAIDREITERLKVLDWYQALQAERKQMVEQKKEHMWKRLYRKFAVGFAEVGFHVQGEGDTWEEAFANADAKKG